MLSLQSSVSELPKFWAATFCPNPDFLSYERGNCHNSLLWKNLIIVPGSKKRSLEVLLAILRSWTDRSSRIFLGPVLKDLRSVGTLVCNMDNGYMIREKNHQTSKVWAFWACQSAAQTKSIYVEKNVAEKAKHYDKRV